MDAWADGFSLQWMSSKKNSAFGQGSGMLPLIIAMAGWWISSPEKKESFAQERNRGIGFTTMSVCNIDQIICLLCKTLKT